MDLADKLLDWLLWYEGKFVANDRNSKAVAASTLDHVQIRCKVTSVLCITRLCRAGSWSFECW